MIELSFKTLGYAILSAILAVIVLFVLYKMLSAAGFT